MTEKKKVGRYEFMAEPFHCDFSHRLFMGHLGNHLLNAADFHSDHRGFGMPYLNPLHKTWVLSRLAVEMEEMPPQYSRFSVETWVESAMRYFTNRNFRIADADDDTHVYGYGRSVWAMIDTVTRQPQNIMEIRGGGIMDYVETEKPCPMGGLSRVRIGGDARLVRTVETRYSDVDVNGHINSVKYIEHVLDLFDMRRYAEYAVRRIDVAYVAESHYGDRLSFYMEQPAENDFLVRVTKQRGGDGEETEVCRCGVGFSKRQVSEINQ